MKARICKEKHWNVHLRFFLVMMGDLLFSVSVLAQSNLITGKVIDNASEPIIGASIQSSVVGKGTISNMNGDFSIEVPVGTELTISFLGYRTQKIKVSDMRSLVIKLLEDTQALDEVVVVGYGVQKKESLTGAISNIKNDEIIKTKATSLAQSLEGKVSGLKIRQNDGEPGQFRSDINIRGLGTPLFIIDGIVRDGANEFQRLNPDDIESISVLKDAASASIYGAKAAFGVVLITTKKGAKSDRVNVSYQGNLSFQNMAKEMKMGQFNALEYSVEAMKRSGKTATGGISFFMTESGLERAREWQNKYGGKLGPDDPYVYGRDWYVDANGRNIGLRTFDPYDYMIREWAPTHSHNVSINGKSGKTTYNIGLGYLHQNGMMKPAKLFCAAVGSELR